MREVSRLVDDCLGKCCAGDKVTPAIVGWWEKSVDDGYVESMQAAITICFPFQLKKLCLGLRCLLNDAFTASRETNVFHLN